MTKKLSTDFIIEVNHVSKQFEDGKLVLNDVSLQVHKGEFVTILGPSGCGKTTLLRCIAGFQVATSGDILLKGEDITQTPPHKRPVNTVFQKYALFPHLNVYDNVAFGLKLKQLDKNVIMKRVKQALNRGIHLTDARRRFRFAPRGLHRVAHRQAESPAQFPRPTHDFFVVVFLRGFHFRSPFHVRRASPCCLPLTV